MPPWEDPDLPASEDEITQRIIDGLYEGIEGWQAHEGAPEVALAEEFGRETASTNALAVESLQLAIAGIGETVFGQVPRVGAAAVLPDVKLELRVWDPLGGLTISRSVSIAAEFTIIAADVAFTLLEDISENDVTFDDQGGGQYRAFLDTPMTAATSGTIGNVPSGTPVTVVTGTGIVVAASIEEDGDGGVDEETLADYLDRVTDYLSILRPGAARADGLAALARTVSGVHRAIGFDLLDPDLDDPQERTATVVAIDNLGQPVAGSTLTELTAVLEAAREVNFNVIMADPTYTDVDVAATVDPVAGVDAGDLEDRVTAAIAALIDPANWGNSDEQPRGWAETPDLRALDVAVAISQVAGVASVVSVTVNGADTTVLGAPAALPAPAGEDVDDSTIAVTVT